MTREKAREAAEVMLAFANGEKIEQYDNYGGKWSEVKRSCCDFNWSKNGYRIKPKERFNPKTLQPFDKVLVRARSGNAYVWFADFIVTPITDNYVRGCIMSNTDTDMVIPYNDDTKHLVGTNKEAPEYYRHWKE